MRRMHVGLRVENLDESIDFYSRLLGGEPGAVSRPTRQPRRTQRCE